MTTVITENLAGFQTLLQASAFSLSSYGSPTHIHTLSSFKPMNVSEECPSSNS